MAAATTSDIRAWAQANGYDVGDRGRLPVEVTEAYHQSNGKRAAKAAPAKKAAPARKAQTAAKAVPSRRPTVVETAHEAPAKSAGAPTIVIDADVPPALALEERVAELEKQLASLRTKLAALEAAPTKRGFGRRR